MEKRKILGCSDYLGLGTSFSKQSRLVMEMVDADWHYLGLGYSGPVLTVPRQGDTPPYAVYPNIGEHLESHFAPSLGGIASGIKPDAVFIYEDVQHVSRYKMHGLDCPVIGYVPWDSDQHLGIMDQMPSAVDVTVVMSDFAKKLFNDRGHDVDVIYNCVDEKAYGACDQGDVDHVREGLGIPKDKKVLLYVGMLHQRKNPESLLAMASHLKRIRRENDWVLLIHGDTKFQYMKCDMEMERLLHGVKDVVKFTDDPSRMGKPRWPDGVPTRSLNAMYNMADIFVSAHGGEGFGIPACEAGLCGKPFVMTGCTTTAEFSDGGRNGVGVPILAHRVVSEPHGDMIRPIPDHVKMAHEVQALLDDEPKRKKMGQRFHEHVLVKYTRNALAPKWKALFDKCFVEKVKVKEI